MEVCYHLWNYFSFAFCHFSQFWLPMGTASCIENRADDWQTLLDSGQSLLVTSGSLTSQVWYLLLLCLESHLLFQSLSFFQPLASSLMYFPWEGSDCLCKVFCKHLFLFELWAEVICLCWLYTEGQINSAFRLCSLCPQQTNPLTTLCWTAFSVLKCGFWPLLAIRGQKC